MAKTHMKHVAKRATKPELPSRIIVDDPVTKPRRNRILQVIRSLLMVAEWLSRRSHPKNQKSF
jgi:hypothetical protein